MRCLLHDGSRLAPRLFVMAQPAQDRRIVTFADLDVWQKSMTLAERCYEAATLLPDSEKFGLALQVRRAAVSIAANIAEGHQLPTASYRHHVSIALGSVAELQTHVELARRLKFLSAEAAGHLQRQLSDVRSMLVRLRSALVRNSR